MGWDGMGRDGTGAMHDTRYDTGQQGTGRATRNEATEQGVGNLNSSTQDTARHHDTTGQTLKRHNARNGLAPEFREM